MSAAQLVDLTDIEVEARQIPEACVGVRVMSPDAEDEGAQGAIVEVSPLRDAVKVQWDEGQATWCMRCRLLLGSSRMPADLA